MRPYTVEFFELVGQRTRSGLILTKGNGLESNAVLQQYLLMLFSKDAGIITSIQPFIHTN
jgi:hypothetical protein